MNDTIFIKGKLTFIEHVQRWLVDAILFLLLWHPTPNSSSASMKAPSQLFLLAHLFLVRSLNFSAQGSVLGTFLFSAPSPWMIAANLIAVDTAYVPMTAPPHPKL